jgi:hypothetical protein
MPKWYGCHMESILDEKDGKEWLFHWGKLATYYKEILSWQEQKSYSHFQYYFIIDFIINCYHLKDWLENSNKVLKINSDINKKIKLLFKDNIEMQCCRDICNAYKHKHYTRQTLDTHPSYIREFNYFENKTEYFFALDDIKNKKFYKIEALELSKKVLSIWEHFLVENNLLKSF